MRHLQPGDRVGALVVEGEIGRGAFSRVYLARDTLVGRLVALKVFHGAEAVAASVRNEVLKEARLIGRLRSPCVVTLYRIHDDPDGGWMIEMEYIEGGSLEGRMRDGPLPLADALEILRATAMALRTAHDNGIVHGDVKPANVLLDADGGAKLADFGLGRFLHDQSLAGTGAVLAGTPLYMAPEVVMGDRPGPPADVWSFGVLLHRLLAGDAPFRATNLHALFLAVLNAPPAPLPQDTKPALAALARQCLAKEATSRPTVAQILSVLDAVRTSTEGDTAPAPNARPPSLFGRREEIRALDRALEAVRTGQGRTLVVCGPAGIGKSALLRASAEIARGRGHAVLTAQVSAVEGLLRPLLEELRLQTSSTTLELLSANRPLFRDFIGGQPVAFESRQQVLWAVERLLAALASERPLCLFLDDAQNAGEEDLVLLGDLTARTAPMQWLLVAAFRGNAPASLTSRRGVSTLELAPLVREDMLRVVREVAKVERVDTDVARSILDLAAGNPLYGQELVRHLLERNAALREGALLKQGPAWGQRDLPRRIQDLVVGRLHDLPEEPRAILDTAAVDGLAFDGEAVAAVLDLPVLHVLRSLQRLYRERRLVEPVPTGFRFAHPIFQEGLYGDLAPALRKELHARLAEHLEHRRDPVDPERLGTHWESAGRPERARGLLIEAAVAAERRQEPARALELFRRAALDAGRIGPEEARDHREACTSLAICLCDAGRHEEADTVFRCLIGAAESSGDEIARLRTQVQRMKMMYPVRGVEALEEEELRRATDVLPPGRMLGLAHYNLGILAKWRRELPEAERRFRQAVTCYEAVGEEGRCAAAMDQLGHIATQRGEYDQADELHRLAAERSRLAGRRANAAIFDVNRAIVALQRGRLQGIEDSLRDSIGTLEVEGVLGSAAHASLVLAYVLYARGEVVGARERLRDARERLEASGPLLALADACLVEAELATLGGAFEEARQALDQAERAAIRCAHVPTRSRAALGRTMLLCLEGKREQAAIVASEVVAASGSSDASFRSDVLLRLAESTLYGLPLETLERARRELGPPAPDVEAVCEGARAFRTAEGPAESLESAARALLDDTQGERQALRHALGHYLRAEALRRQGRSPEAREAAGNALEIARRMGHRWLDERAAALVAAD